MFIQKVSSRSGWNVQKATNVFNQQSHVTRDNRAQVQGTTIPSHPSKKSDQRSITMLFSSENQATMAALYGSRAFLGQARSKENSRFVYVYYDPGKTTLSFALEEFLVSRGIAAYGLDGDNVRFVATQDVPPLNHLIIFTHQDRIKQEPWIHP